ncbi:MAG: hypothetical protein AB1797_08435 [bacterium]
MKKMLLSLGLTLGLVLCAINSVQAETVESGKGAFKLGTILQAGFLMAEDETTYPPSQDANENTSFTLNRARLLATGQIGSESVKWYIETEMKHSPEILEAKITFPGLIPMTDLSVGCLAPNFTHYAPMSVAKLDFINYPRLVYAYGMGYQCGIQSTTNLENGVSFNLGVFNGGAGAPPNNFSDDNDDFDFLGRLAVSPIEGLDVAAYHWQGAAGAEGDVSFSRTGIEAGYSQQGLRLLGEFVMGSGYPFNEDIDSQGYFAQALYKREYENSNLPEQIANQDVM